MGGSAKTPTNKPLGYLSTIESDLQTQLNNLKFTTNKRMYVNDQTVQTAEYTLTIGMRTNYKYTLTYLLYLMLFHIETWQDKILHSEVKKLKVNNSSGFMWLILRVVYQPILLFWCS